MRATVRRSIARLLVVSVASLGIPVPVQAGTVSTEETIAGKRDRVAATLNRDDVRAQLEARGVSATDAQARVQAMTDEGVAQVADRIDTLPAGGNPIAAIATAGAAVMYAAIWVVVWGIVNAVNYASKKQPKQPSTEESVRDVSPFPAQG